MLKVRQLTNLIVEFISDFIIESCLLFFRCEPDQEINDPGSNFKDRTCRKKISQLHFPQPITKNVTSIEREIPGARKNFSENDPGHNSSNVTKSRDTNNGIALSGSSCKNQALWHITDFVLNKNSPISQMHSLSKLNIGFLI